VLLGAGRSSRPGWFRFLGLGAAGHVVDLNSGRHIRLIEMKLRPPVTNDWSLERSELQAQLDAALSGRLAVLAAPAGFGKTVLVEQWTRRLRPDVAIGWLSLDAGDGEPVRFWSYFVECLRRIGADVSDRLIADLWIDPSSIEELVAASVNALTRIEGPQVIVIDDLHHVTSTATLESLFRFAEAIPSSTTAVLMSRSVPSWPLERLRAQGDVLILGTNEMAFSRLETAAVIQTVAADVVFQGSDIEDLYRRSEGWPVAVRLAADGLRRQACPHRLLADFRTSDRLVTGYLLEEVLSGLSPSLHRFLLDVSILDRFSAELAEAVTNGPADELLSELTAESLFAVSIDEESQWHRLHQLIRDLLLSDLAKSDPARVRVLHRRAAAWYRENGSVDAAVEHLLAAGDYDAVVELIESVVDKYYLSGGTESIIDWLRLVPQEQLELRPRAASLLARMLVVQGWFDEARGWIDVAERASKTDCQRLDVIIARLRLDRALGQETAVLDSFAELDSLSEVATDRAARIAARVEQGNALGIRAMCHEFLGQTDRYRAALVELEARRQELGPAAAFTVDPTLARAAAEDGELHQAASHARLAIQRADRQGVELHALTYAYLALAQVSWCRGQLDEAEASLRLAAQHDNGAGIWSRTILAVRAAEILASVARYDQVDDILESAWNGSPGARTPSTSRRWIAAWGLAINAVHQRSDAAYRWLSELDRLDATGELPHALWAHVELLRGNPQKVVARFGSDGSKLPPQPLPKLRSGLALFQSLLLCGREAEADALGRPLVLHAEHHELLQPVREFPAIIPHSGFPGAAAPSDGFLERLTIRADKGLTDSTNPDLPEPISAREADLIRLLPTRLTNQEIATELYISLNTVKTHLRNIYRKLGVQNRDAAISRCEELGILRPLSLNHP